MTQNKFYEEAKIEVIYFSSEDVIVTSGIEGPNPPDFEPPVFE